MLHCVTVGYTYVFSYNVTVQSLAERSVVRDSNYMYHKLYIYDTIDTDTDTDINSTNTLEFSNPDPLSRGKGATEILAEVYKYSPDLSSLEGGLVSMLILIRLILIPLTLIDTLKMAVWIPGTSKKGDLT